MSDVPPLRNPRFSPMFWTQFAGAFNDNFFKNALVMLVTYGGATVFGLDAAAVVALASALFILPFFLFSATAGQLADRYEKSMLIRRIKLVEIGIMVVAALGFAAGRAEVLLLVLFAMGTQSAFFGPVKYGILPQLLDDEDLVGGNALVELATYLAILGGTILGGVLVNQTIGGVPGTAIIGVGVIVVALIGWWTSKGVPDCPAEQPDLEVQWEPVRPTLKIIAMARRKRPIWLAIGGITWFWGFGAVLLALFPPYTKEVLHADEAVATLFLAAFSLGIGAGSILCERLSKHRLELGIVPIGSIGMSLFAFDLWWVGTPWTLPDTTPLLSLSEFVARQGGVRILIDLVGLAMAGGLFIVPLYTFLQTRAEDGERSRIIAANNILNSAFMVVASLGLLVVQGMGWSVTSVFGLLAALNVVVAAYVYTVVPEFMLRFLTWVLSNVLYRVKVEGIENLPRDGGAVVVANHITYVDWLLLAGAVPRPLRLVMDKKFGDTPIIGALSREGGVIPIASAKRDPELLEAAMTRISEDLREGWMVGLFPEGRLTADGDIDTFRPGIERIIETDPVPVIPVAINGLWGSWFSRHGGAAMKKRPSRFWSRVHVTIGTPVPPEEVTAERLEAEVRRMWDQGAP